MAFESIIHWRRREQAQQVPVQLASVEPAPVPTRVPTSAPTASWRRLARAPGLNPGAVTATARWPALPGRAAAEEAATCRVPAT